MRKTAAKKVLMLLNSFALFYTGVLMVGTITIKPAAFSNYRLPTWTVIFF